MMKVTIKRKNFNKLDSKNHKTQRACVENAWQSQHTDQISSERWRHSRSFYSLSLKLNACLYNFKRRIRLQRGIILFFDQWNKIENQ